MRVNLTLMKVIYCYQIPKEGDTLALEEWVLGKHDIHKETIGEVKVVKVETRIVSEWNPILKERQDEERVYATLDWNGKLYIRHCIIGRT